MAGLSLGGFIVIVIALAILNVAGVVAYYKLGMKEKIFASEVVRSELAPILRYGLLGLLVFSWIFSIACTAACTFVKVEQNVFSGTLYLGLHGAEIHGNCHSGDTKDNRVNMAYAFAVLNNLLTSAVLIGCPLVIFNVIKDANTANKIWKTMGFLMLASTWFCLFTFYVQQALFCHGGVVVCSLGGAGVAQVFNSIFLIGICVLFFVLPLPASEEEDGKNEKDDSAWEKKHEEENKKEKSEEEDKKKDVEKDED